MNYCSSSSEETTTLAVSAGTEGVGGEVGLAGSVGSAGSVGWRPRAAWGVGEGEAMEKRPEAAKVEGEVETAHLAETVAGGLEVATSAQQAAHVRNTFQPEKLRPQLRLRASAAACCLSDRISMAVGLRVGRWS